MNDYEDLECDHTDPKIWNALMQLISESAKIVESDDELELECLV